MGAAEVPPSKSASSLSMLNVRPSTDDARRFDGVVALRVVLDFVLRASLHKEGFYSESARAHEG